MYAFSLKGTVPRDFRLTVFFHESVSHKPLITLGSFQFFRKFTEIFKAQGILPVSLTPVANRKNLQSESLTYFLGHLCLVELTYRFAKFGTGVVDTGGKFAASVVDTGGKLANSVVDPGGAP
jgi:hypothetical protein